MTAGVRPGLVMTNAFTTPAWIHPTGPGSDPLFGGTISNKEGGYEISRFADGTIRCAVMNSSPGWNWVNTGFAAHQNAWTHLVWSYSSAEGLLKVYANGTLISLVPGSGSNGDNHPGLDEFRIGRRQGTPQFFQGLIDEVRVYNRALNPGEALTWREPPNGNP